MLLLLILASHATPAAPNPTAAEQEEIRHVEDEIIEQIAAAARLAGASRLDALPLLQKNLDLLAVASRRSPVKDERTERTFEEYAPILVMHQLGRCNALLKQGDLDGAFRDAQTLATWLDSVQDIYQVQPSVYLVLAELASHATRPREATEWAQRCEMRCADPEQRAKAATLIAASTTRVSGQRTVSIDPVTDMVVDGSVDPPGPTTELAHPEPSTAPRRGQPDLSPVPKGFRFGLTLIPGPTAGNLQGASVRRALSVGASIAVQTRHSSGCAQLSLSRDGWSVPEHPSELKVQRVRAELSWCPTLLQLPLTDQAVVSVRPQIGAGVSTGRFDDAIVGDARIVGYGLRVGLEAPLRMGKVEVTPAIDLSPYGRATTWSLQPDRRDLAFMDRWSLALSLNYTPRSQ